MNAWAIGHLGRITAYSYTYDQPPLGWIQIAGWTGLAGGFSRYADPVIAAREFMVVATLVSVILLWFLARRIGLGRAASGVAAIVFALSPLAIQFHRTVYLDNVATPWLLASLLLAMTKRKQLVGFAGSAAALGIAALSQEAYLLALPLVAALMWRNAHPQTRRYTLSVAATLLVLICGMYVMFALVQGQFFPRANQPSLISGLTSAFGTHGSGQSQQATSWPLGTTFGEWRQLDPVQFFIAPVVAVVGLFIRRIRLFAVALVVLIALAFVFAFSSAGYLSSSYIVMLLPIAALVIAGVVDRGMHRLRSRGIGTALRISAALVVLGIAGVALIPTWGPQLHGLLFANREQPAARQAENWVIENVPKDSRLVVDDSMWIDLVKAGFATDNVVWFPKLDSDYAVKAQSPQGWKDSDYVVSTDLMRSSTDAASAASAITNSVVVASFGTGDRQVQIRKIAPAGATKAQAEQQAEQRQRKLLGDEVTRNPMLSTSEANAVTLRSGRVDPRIQLLIGQLGSTGAVAISRLPVIPGEAGLTIREVVLSGVNGKSLSSNGRLTATGRGVIASLAGPFAAQSAMAVPGGLLITFSVALPAGIIQ